MSQEKESKNKFSGLRVSEEEMEYINRMKPLAIGSLKREDMDDFVECFMEIRTVVQDFCLHVYKERLEAIYSKWSEEQVAENRAKAELFLNIVERQRKAIEVIQRALICLSGNPLTFLRLHRNILPWDEIVSRIEKVLLNASEEDKVEIVLALRRSLEIPQHLFPEFQAEFSCWYDGDRQQMKGINLERVFDVFDEYVARSNEETEDVQDTQSKDKALLEILFRDECE